MTVEQFIGLESNLEWLKAKKMLDAAKRGEIPLTADGWYNLTHYVTGSEAEAQKAYSEYIKRELRANRTPE